VELVSGEPPNPIFWKFFAENFLFAFLLEKIEETLLFIVNLVTYGCVPYDRGL